jgi:hypothetical protein
MTRAQVARLQNNKCVPALFVTCVTVDKSGIACWDSVPIPKVPGGDALTRRGDRRFLGGPQVTAGSAEPAPRRAPICYRHLGGTRAQALRLTRQGSDLGWWTVPDMLARGHSVAGIAVRDDLNPCSDADACCGPLRSVCSDLLRDQVPIKATAGCRLAVRDDQYSKRLRYAD